MNETNTVPPKPSLPSRLLGLFVAFQVIYLPLSNLWQLLPRELPAETSGDIRIQKEGSATSIRPLQVAINSTGMFIDRYGEATGQAQVWSLFAEFGRQTIIPVVEFEFMDKDGQVVMRNEPPLMRLNPDRYLRWPGADSRLLSYEFLLAVVYWHYSESSLQARGPEWREAVRAHVRRVHKQIEAYFRYQLATLRRDQPNLPEPVAGILKVRIHPSPQPGERTRPPAFLMPLARWSPNLPADAKRLPVEAYDPVQKEFVPLIIE